MDLTLVLVGPAGHGKSATGNYILGREAFRSRNHSSSGTVTCELQSTLLEDGRTISVIDTPGFVHTEFELLGEEVKKCIHLARNRIHAILFVVSARSGEKYDLDAIRKLQRIFGENIINYMILVFKDVVYSMRLEQEIVHLCQGRYVHFNNKTKDAPKRSIQVQNLLSQVKTVISHNDGKPSLSQVFEIQLQAESTVRDATTRLEQLVEAHATTINANKEHMAQRIDAVEARLRDTTTSLEQKMETTTLKADERAEKYLKEETSELIRRISKSYEEQMTQRLEAVVEQRVLGMTTQLEQQLVEAHATHMRVNEILQCEISELILQMTQSINEEAESRLKDVTTRLEQQLAEAEAARLKADERAQEAQNNSDEQVKKLVKTLETTMDAEEISKLIQQLNKSNQEQTMQRIDAVEARLRDTTTQLMKVNEKAQQQMKQNFIEEVESMKDVTTRLEQQLAEAEAARLKADERAQEAQKNSDEQIQKLKEMLDGAESRRSETIREFGSSSFHVYDPSTYLLQSAIK